MFMQISLLKLLGDLNNTKFSIYLKNIIIILGFLDLLLAKGQGELFWVISLCLVNLLEDTNKFTKVIYLAPILFWNVDIVFSLSCLIIFLLNIRNCVLPIFTTLLLMLNIKFSPDLVLFSSEVISTTLYFMTLAFINLKRDIRNDSSIFVLINSIFITTLSSEIQYSPILYLCICLLVVGLFFNNIFKALFIISLIGTLHIPENYSIYACLAVLSGSFLCMPEELGYKFINIKNKLFQDLLVKSFMLIPLAFIIKATLSANNILILFSSIVLILYLIRGQVVQLNKRPKVNSWYLIAVFASMVILTRS